jgi:LemA protein
LKLEPCGLRLELFVVGVRIWSDLVLYNFVMEFLIAIAVLVAMLLWIALNIFNGLVVKRNAIKNVQGTVDILLKKRADLVPNLVEVVKGYAKHEQVIFQQIAQLRTTTLSRSRLEAMRSSAELTLVLGELLVMSEAYPSLQANRHFLHLQHTLVELEEQISAARRAYNATVTEFNNGLEQFPSGLFARQMKLVKVPLFDAALRETNPKLARFK